MEPCVVYACGLEAWEPFAARQVDFEIACDEDAQGLVVHGAFQKKGKRIEREKGADEFARDDVEGFLRADEYGQGLQAVTVQLRKVPHRRQFVVVKGKARNYIIFSL